MTTSLRHREAAERPAGSPSGASGAGTYPDNPVLVQLWRGKDVESQHRGAWVLTDASGAILDGAGRFEAPIFTRSSVKCLQALPLLETGAAARFGFDDADVALALSSHNAEPCHTERVERTLARLGLDVQALRCGPQPPVDPDARRKLREERRSATALHNNCSGKHAGFLALALHLGVAPARYLDPESASQRLVRKAVADLTDVDVAELGCAIDGCSAPTFRMPLRALATAFARVSSPSGLAPLRAAACERMLDSVARNPVLLAGSHQRLCTDIARVSGGRLFPKIGGEAVYALGVRGRERALAVKIDDGAGRALHAVVVALLRRFDLATSAELEQLAAWEERTVRNWAGLEVGRTEVLV